MTEPETSLIRSITPKREWLLRCSDNNLDLTVCSICVSNGDIEIIGPETDLISLSPGQTADFHAALHEAIELAEADLRQRQRERAQA